MSEQNEVVNNLKRIVDAHWNKVGRPLLLSNLAPLLGSELPNYRELIGANSLKAFIEETSELGGYKLVKHPSQRAKIGYIPANEDFKFELTENSVEQSDSQKLSTRAITLDFIKALKTLSKEELSEVHIPVSVFVKLLE